MSRRSVACARLWGILLVILAIGGPSRSAWAQQRQLTPDEQAAMVLDSARRAYNQGNQQFAADRFREFLRQYGGHRDAPAAQYGLALSLLEMPQRDLKAAMDALQQVVGRQEFPDRGFALYYLGAAQRDLGRQALADAVTKPNEAANLRSTAQRHFEDASKNFALACDAFTAKLKAPAAPVPGAAPAADPAVPGPEAKPAVATGEEPPERDWLVRARCDLCEMLLRLQKFKEALDLSKGMVEDKELAKGPFRPLCLYQCGYATFALGDHKAAAALLSQLAPFQQEFGVHARYLLARTHHLSDERPEAVALYKALLADYEQQKKAAQQALQNPGALAVDERARLEAFTKGPPPDYVVRASFYAALLQAEEGRYGEASDAFTALLQIQPRTSMADEAQLRQGYCQLQLRNFAEATKVLQPLHNHPQFSDRALWWTARTQIGAADPNNAQNYEQALRNAMDLLNRAANQANDQARTDPQAKIRRGDMLMELADVQQLAKQYQPAVDTYRRAITEAANPDRVEEAMQRIVTALHLAGQYKASDEACVKFEQTYPASTLLPLVWFRAAENARLSAMAATADQNMRGKKAELDKMFEEAVTRYQRVLKKFPEFPYVNLARYGLGLSYYHQEKYAESLAALTEIAGADRIGDLAGVPYMLADCLLRLLPAETDDGLKGAQLLERAEQAGKLLEGFAMSLDAKSTLAPDAWLKLGYCYQRMGMALADPAEKTKVFTAARQAYEKISQQYNNSPAMPYSVFERAKCMALQGDANGAINELNRFQGDPLKNSPVAPLALVRLAGLLRSQNRMADALKAMEQCRQLEGGLKDDPLRSQWIPLIQYEHALAVKESGKPVEARAMFDALAKQFPTRLEGVNALWRSGQCRRDELQAAIATAKATIVKPGVQRPQIEAAIKAVTDGLAAMAQTAEFFKTEAAKLAQSVPDSEARLRMLYELAWCQRTLAEAEIIAAREKLQRAALDKVLENFRKRNQPAPALNAPDVPLSAVLPQPSEKAARDAYAAVIASKSEAAVVARARLELAEMMQERGEITGALEVLAPALDLSPPLELAERIRLRTASCLIAKKDAKTALAQLQPVLQNAKSTLAAEARYLAGDAHIAAKDWPNAVTQLLPFRDQDPWRNVPEVADKALMRLGYALAQANRWDESRQAYENLVQRFQQSPWFFEARYGIGWAHKNANRHEEAVNAFNEVTRGTAAEVAARAQLHAGLCRLAQKRFPEAATALLVVPTTYDCPEHSAPALCEAGQAQLEQKKVAEAVKLWESVIKDYPTSNWAEVAKQRLAGVKKP